MKKIVLTGGGTAGHVTPNIAIIPTLREREFDIFYIGSYEGIEKKLITDIEIPYYGVATGKLRRYLDPKNFSDPFKVVKGYEEAKKILKDIQPDIVFSKGGFVSVPVVRAAKALKIPCIIHESDMTPGLANKICIPAASKVCCNFPETAKKLPEGKAIVTGSPIRQELLTGNKAKAKELCGFTNDKPVIMVMGGSQGSVAVNEAVRDALPKLLDDFNIVHLCGNGKVDNLLLVKESEGYKQFEYLKGELKDVLALADVVITRGGANAICELKALNKPNLIIPLPAKSSRGDQILNAESFRKQGFSMVLDEDDIDPDVMVMNVKYLYEHRKDFIDRMAASNETNAIDMIVNLIEETAK